MVYVDFELFQKLVNFKHDMKALRQNNKYTFATVLGELS